MNLFPDVGQTAIDLSDITFEKGYVIPAARTIAANHQQGVEMTPGIKEAWKTQNHEVAAEFIMSYYRSQGFENSVEVISRRDDPDCLGGVRVTARDKNGLDYTTFTVWESQSKFYVEEYRGPDSVWAY
jgi:hypothetical protein